MTHKLPRYLLVVTVASVAAISCREQSVAVVPPLIPLQKSSLVGGPSASVAKPLDAASSDSRREAHAPPAPCLNVAGGREAALPDLLNEAARDFEAGRYENALECAREASRGDPASVAAHHFRGAALAELGHIDEARTAYARAMALDPDDPESAYRAT